MENFGLNVNVDGKNIPDYIAGLIERNEKNEIEIERGKLSVAALKQLNNHCRLLLDVQKFEMKKMEMELKQGPLNFER